MLLRLSSGILCRAVMMAVMMCYGALALHAAENKVVLKAAIIAKLAKFVEWPAKGAEAFVMAVSDEQFYRALSHSQQSKKIHQRPVLVQYAEDVSAIDKADIVFLTADDAQILSDLHPIAQKSHILTISDARGFAERGGMVQMYQVDQRIRLKINLDAVRQAGLSMRSSLLNIAEIVQTREEVQ